MALTKAQYQNIIRSYEETQDRNRSHLQARKAEVYASLPEYQSLEAEAASLSGSFTRRLIDGEPGAREELSKSLQRIAQEKAKLLKKGGFSADYLDPIYTCPLCKDTGFIGSRKCSCFEKQIRSILYRQSGILDVLERENFDTLSYAYFDSKSIDSYKKIVSVCKDFVEHFDDTNSNLLFTGSVGRGKTFLSNCIAKALLDTGHSVLYFTSVDFFETFSKNVFDKNKEHLYSFYDDLYNCDLVILDDLGTELHSDFVCTYFFSFLNERLLRRKSTLISTNLDRGELLERYDERCLSRLVSNYTVCPFSGPDIRIQRRK